MVCLKRNLKVLTINELQTHELQTHELQTMSTSDERIVDLEIRSAEQQQTIDELSDMIAQQWRKIDELISLNKTMRGRVLAIEDKLPDDDKPPPHY